MTKQRRQFGLWDSPLTPSAMAGERRLEAAYFDDDGTLVWLEGRSGQGVLLAASQGGAAPRELTTDINVRAEVGYGGGDFTVHNGRVYFVAYQSGRIYRQAIEAGPAQPITPSFGKASSPAVSPDGRWVAYVHHDSEGRDRIAVVDAEGRNWPQILTEGRDFYMQPRWSPAGRQLAWICWDHPQMPWDGTSLYLADVVGDSGLPRVGEARLIAGGPETAIFQGEFLPDGRQMVYVSDETGWGRIAIHNLDDGSRRWLTPDGDEYAMPAWLQDRRTFAILDGGRRLAAFRNRHGFQTLVQIDVQSGEISPAVAFESYPGMAHVSANSHGDRIAVIASGPKTPPRVVSFETVSRNARVVARASGETTPPVALADCEAISWETAGGDTAHGLYYSPASERFDVDGRPPVIVYVHGGPTSQATARWLPDVQFLATRGYAVLLVNYRGSTGHGRDYMLKLRGNWGICDVEDCVSGARHLADRGKIDPQRTAIMGGSAGGFTVLQTMIAEPEAFTAGVCLFGVADQFHLAAQTHKFESRYLNSLLGPLPEAAEVYRQRSPVLHADKIKRPLAVFQGADDRVVPREQSDRIVEALTRSGTPHEYHLYEGEGHGWRRSETIEHYYKALDAFLRRHVIFT
jgi:dipeptidyl aminopeptidase/acylaminoacyl peptidase